MTLEARARRAVQEIHHAVGADGSAGPVLGDPARFHRDRARKARNQQLVAAVVAVAIAVGSVLLVARTFRSREMPATPVHPGGSIVFVSVVTGAGDPNHLFTMNPD